MDSQLTQHLPLLDAISLSHPHSSFSSSKSIVNTAPDIFTMSSPTKPSPEERPRDHRAWTRGDFEVITADRVRFRVPSYVLFGAR